MNMREVHHDLKAAVVGALTALPQTVAYGLIAVAPLGPEWAVFGITASVGTALLFGLLAGMFGANPFLLSGPRVITVLVLASAIQTAVHRGFSAQEALMLAFLGLFVAGLLQASAGLLRLGSAVSYIPVPVLTGFVNASSILVFLSALPMALGAAGFSLAEIAGDGFTAIRWWAVSVSIVSMMSVFVLAGRLNFIPTTLAGLIVGSLAYYVGTAVFAQPVGPMVGTIDVHELWRWPFLLNAPLSTQTVLSALDIPVLSGITIGLLNAFDTVLTSRAIDVRTNQPGNVNRDLQVQGLLNTTMGGLGFLPGAGALSRSIAVVEAGARTRLANIGASIVFGLMLIFLAPLIAGLPLWATAGMLLAIAVQSLDKPVLTKMWQLLTRKLAYPRVVAGDVGVMLVVIATALAFDLIAAVGMGMFLSVVLFVLGMGRNPVRRIFHGARVHSKVQRSALQMEWLEQEGQRIAIVELQGALFFGSCARFLSEGKALLNAGADYLILDCRHLTSIDSTGAAAVRTLHLLFAENGGEVFISHIEPERRTVGGGWLSKPQKDDAQCRRTQAAPRWNWLTLDANGVTYALGEEQFFSDTDRALAKAEDRLLRRAGKSDALGFRGVIASSLLFSGLSRPDIMRLGRTAERHHFKPGETVFAQGDPGDRAYFLVFGRMDVLIDIPGTNRKKRVSALTEGTLFGEMGLIDGDSRSASVVAKRDSACFSIDRETFARLRKSEPEITATLLVNLSRMFAGRLRVANLMISELEQ